MNFSKYLDEQKAGSDLSWRDKPKNPMWPPGHPNYKENKKPKKTLAQKAGKLVSKMGKKATKAAGKGLSFTGSALSAGFSKIFGLGKAAAEKKRQQMRNQKRAPAIEASHAKNLQKRKSLAQKLPKNMKREKKNEILANIRGVRHAVKRWDDTQLHIMHAKHKNNDTPLAYSLKAELKARKIRKKREIAKIDKALIK